MKRNVLLALAVIGGGTGAAHAQWAGAAAALGAAYNPGTIPIGTPAITIQLEDITGVNLNPNVYGAYIIDGVNNPTAGFFPDHHWIGDGGLTPQTGAIYTFASRSADYYHYCAIDHEPIPFEGLEQSLWGSPDGGSSWVLGTVMEVFEQGWDPSALTDDGAARWQFPFPVDMVSVVVGLSQGTYSFNDADYETDAVMQVPAPGAAGLGLLALGAASRRRRR